jgi:hypothetical protein
MGDRTIFAIKTSTARNISGLSAITKEHEMLLLPGTPFIVVGVLPQGNGLTKIALEEVTDAPALIDSGEDAYTQLQDPGSFYNLVGDGDALTKAMYALDMAMLAEGGMRDDDDGAESDYGKPVFATTVFTGTLMPPPESDSSGGGGGCGGGAVKVTMHAELHDIRKVASSGFKAFDPELAVMRPMLFIADAASGETLHILPIEFLRRYAMKRATDAHATFVVETGRRIPGGPSTHKYRMSGANQDVVGAMMKLVDGWKATLGPRQRTTSKPTATAAASPAPSAAAGGRRGGARGGKGMRRLPSGDDDDDDDDGGFCDEAFEGFGSDGDDEAF